MGTGDWTQTRESYTATGIAEAEKQAQEQAQDAAIAIALAEAEAQYTKSAALVAVLRQLQIGSRRDISPVRETGVASAFAATC